MIIEENFGTQIYHCLNLSPYQELIIDMSIIIHCIVATLIHNTITVTH